MVALLLGGPPMSASLTVILFPLLKRLMARAKSGLALTTALQPSTRNRLIPRAVFPFWLDFAR